MLTNAEKEDIRRSYREAKNKEMQIDIMKDLYLVPKEEIIQVLTDSKDYLPKRAGRPAKCQVVVKRTEAATEKPGEKKEALTQSAKKAYPLNRPGDAVVNAIKREYERVEADIRSMQQALKLAEQAASELREFLDGLGEEV